MRFMMFMIPEGYQAVEAGTTPSLDSIAEMRMYNENLQKAGVLLALDGIHPPSMGARVSFTGGKPAITDGPFTEAKEAIGGYWIIQVKTREEALEWASRCPAKPGDVIEVRPFMEFSDFPPDVQRAMANLPAIEGEER